MPGTIFDDHAAAAARRDAEFRQVLDEMAHHARTRPHRPTRAAEVLAPAAPPPIWSANAVIKELGDLERWHVVDEEVWNDRVAWLVEFYRDETLFSSSSRLRWCS